VRHVPNIVTIDKIDKLLDGKHPDSMGDIKYRLRLGLYLAKPKKDPMQRAFEGGQRSAEDNPEVQAQREMIKKSEALLNGDTPAGCKPATSSSSVFSFSAPSHPSEVQKGLYSLPSSSQPTIQPSSNNRTQYRRARAGRFKGIPMDEQLDYARLVSPEGGNTVEDDEYDKSEY